MFPTLSDLLREVFGIDIPLPIQSYGFMVAVALLLGAWVFYLEYKRKEKESVLLPVYIEEKVGYPASFSELFWTFIITFILAWKFVYAFVHYGNFVDNPQGMVLSSKGSTGWGIIIAAAVTIYQWWNKNRKKLEKPEIKRVKTYPHQLVGNMLVIAGVFGLIGAKVFDVFQPQNFAHFIKHPIQDLVSFSGLTFYGGLIGGFAAAIWYLKKYNINVIQSLDAFAPAGALGYGVGRIGCELSGDGCWGIVNTTPKPGWLSWLPDWAWSFDFPHNVIHEGVPIAGYVGKFNTVLPQPVYPTSLYETTIMLIVFVILWSLRKKIKIPGILFSMYLIFAGFERFFIEFLRVTHKYNIFGLKLTQGQIISIILIAIGTFFIFHIMKNKERFERWGTTNIKDINKEKIDNKKLKK